MTVQNGEASFVATMKTTEIRKATELNYNTVCDYKAPLEASVPNSATAYRSPTSRSYTEPIITLHRSTGAAQRRKPYNIPTLWRVCSLDPVERQCVLNSSTSLDKATVLAILHPPINHLQPNRSVTTSQTEGLPKMRASTYDANKQYVCVCVCVTCDIFSAPQRSRPKARTHEVDIIAY